ncbi:DUF6894 family protein [Sphingomonas sp. SUN019]|uniref:DUF6894 family protein n=1 Tax=Sphingomonas sp. SUN019 TaxID=2937788 RepID=UPI0038D42C67
MARFYFHLHECGHVVSDEDGIERADLDGVRSAAVVAARDIMCSEIRKGKLCLSCHIEVCDEHDVSVMVVRFSDAVAVTGFIPN